jgi:hypothetical protein
MKNPSNKKPSRIFFLLFSLAILMLVDLSLWLISPVPLVQPITYLYKQNLPGVKKSVLYALNQYGLRSESIISKEKNSRTIRIFCIGGSTTQMVTQNFADTWYGLLEKRLNDEYSKRKITIELAAWGQGGYKVWHGCRFCRGELPEFKPDIAITLWGINNLAFDGGPGYAYKNKEERLSELTGHSWLRSVVLFTTRYSQICRRLRMLAETMRIRRGIRTGAMIENWQNNLVKIRSHYEKLPYAENVVRSPDPIFEFQDAIDEQLRCLKEQKIETIVLGHPALWKENLSDTEKATLWFPINSAEGRVRPSGKWLEMELKKYNDVQKRTADKFHAHFLDLDAVIPKTTEYFLDDCHFTDKANVIVASALYDLVAEAVESVARVRKIDERIEQLN